jgi:beta-N-acetylhexosaminidase
LLAGNDIIMFSKTPLLYDQVWTTMVASMKDDAELRSRVREAARRILTVKLKYLRGEGKVPYVPDLEKIQAELPDPEGSAFFLSLAARSVTLLKGSEPLDKIFPLSAENAGRVLLAGQYEDFFRAGRAAFPNATFFRYTYSQTADQLLSYARNADTVIFCLSDSAGLRLLRNLEPLKKRLIVLSVLSPVYLERVPWVSGAVAVYSYAPESFLAGFSAITGRINAAGKLPYEL